MSPAARHHVDARNREVFDQDNPLYSEALIITKALALHGFKRLAAGIAVDALREHNVDHLRAIIAMPLVWGDFGLHFSLSDHFFAERACRRFKVGLTSQGSLVLFLVPEVQERL